MEYQNALGIILRLSREPSSWIGGGGVIHGNAGDGGFYGAGNDCLIGGLGDDTYRVWVPSTTVIENADGGVDTLDARIWGDVALPENVENLLLNGPGSTTGTGNGLDNIIVAGTVGATLDGLAGNDVLIAGAGPDILRVQAGNGSDVIIGFTPGSDVIQLVGYGISTFDQLRAIATSTGGDLTLSFDNRESLVLRGVSLSDLDGYDFGLPQPLPALPPGHQALTGPSKVYSAFGWYVLNNVWNPGPLDYLTDYTIDSTYNPLNLTAAVTFSWSFPLVTRPYSTILAYPEVIFGPAPMSGGKKPTDIAGVFPLQVGEIVSLVADYDVAYDGNTDGFNVAFDIWLTNRPNGGGGDVTNEVMVWVHRGGVIPYGKIVGTYRAGDISADIYMSSSGDWTYTAIVLDEDRPAGEISISGILAKLKSLGIVSDSEYVASVELGAEIISGAGRLTINDLTLDARLADRTITVTGAGVTVRPVEAPLHLSGDDRIPYDAAERVIVGGDGTDTLVVNVPLTVNLGNFSTSQVAGPAYVGGFEGVDAAGATGSVVLIGSAHANVLTGSNFADRINAGGGADIVRGGGGNDVIDGESGADRLYGDNGDDRIVYDAGDYVIDGGQGTDTLVLKGAA